MLRSCFFAVGLFVTLWGVSFLFVDKLVLKSKAGDRPEQGFRAMLGFANNQERKQKILDPPDWAAFSLMSVGTVSMLYSIALPKKKKEGP